MCGIIGCAGHEGDTVPVLLNGLARLEYRGYDSTGLAVSNSDIHVVKREGELDELVETVESEIEVDGVAGVGHTRWSTHGKPSDANAHPHTDCENRVAVVHNGIIENYQSLRDDLRSLGHEFESNTDTEVIPHLVGHYLDAGSSPKAAFHRAVEKLEGSYAIAAVFESRKEVMATRQDSSLVLGVGDEATYVASDMTALIERTDSVIHLDDGEFAFLSPDGYTIIDEDGERQSKAQTTIEWDVEEITKGHHDHYMIKEIYEQSAALRECLRNRSTTDRLISLDTFDDYHSVDRVHLVACGTSYHAALFGAQMLRERGVSAQAFLASEYAMTPAPVQDGTLVVGVTQSGETADTLAALRAADERGARTLALTNVVGSSAARECDEALYIRSGPEISVAATKTFASQLVTLTLFALHSSSTESNHETRRLVSALDELPGQIQRLFDTTTAGEIASRLADGSGYFFIGRGLQYPVALEGALKMKEITYEHAEGFAAGELKHGPLALVTDETPVFVSAVGDNETVRKTVANAEEVKARGAPLVAITDGTSSIERLADEVLRVPSTSRELAPVLVNVQYQLLAYHTARHLGRKIDKPRNLAKSVTVE
ncbi:glutamine--fructose-6-phosphate transaminase (isomerizing) [Haladaptatus caseinilyticus]|uniref:glutamine--fructose-6-phosphate transaminase (isomerizing) n=1 Tax=Haladaptatus caseinilyticus TaxID=2993314 RepID=UPI00224B0AC8|nr:glutamine--fructose-6-phosphate transaminase (isomerizing) [Haladaptatus caseinilyticus]